MKTPLSITMLLVPLLILAACAGGEAEPPEATVPAWLDAFYELDADRLVALHIPEQRQVQRPGYESWVAEVQAALAQTGPASARSSMLRALWTEPALEEVELHVLSESDTDTVIEARTKPVSDSYSPFRWKFRLSRPGDQWLIHGLSGFVPDGVLVWIEVVVSDDQGNPVPGAQLTVDVAGQPVTRLTDDSGLAIFQDIMSPVELDAITVVKEGFSIASKGSQVGFYSVELRPSPSVAAFSMTLPAPRPTPVPGSITINTTDTTVRDARVSMAIGNAVDLSTIKPEKLTDAPPAQGTAYYGLFLMGVAGHVAVMFDSASAAPNQGGGILYTGTTNSGSLANSQQRLLTICCGSSDVITTTLDYGDDSAPISYKITVVSNSAQPYAQIAVSTLRVGQLPGSTRRFMIADNLGGGRFDGGTARLLQDVYGDGRISRENSGEVQPVLGATLQGEGEAWEVVWVSASGRTVQLSPKKSGVIRGQVRTLAGAEAIGRATIRLWPGPFEAISAGDGSFTLEAYTGDPWKILVSKEGYSPFTYDIEAITQSPGDRITVVEETETSFNVDLETLATEISGTFTFGLTTPIPNIAGSFDGARGLAERNKSGDFNYIWVFGNLPAVVCACAEGQRGIVELGDRGSTALDQVTIPTEGYVLGSNLKLQAGFVYVSKAREGLEGHFVIFRVDAITETAVTVSYLFR
jgi:hypothetical protein